MSDHTQRARRQRKARKPGPRAHAVRLPRPRRAPLTGWRRWVFPLVAVLLPVAILAGLEGGLRLSGYGYPSSFFVALPGSNAYVTNPRFGWRFFPPAIARTPRVAWLPADKPSRTYRIFVLGESAAMGIPEPAFGFSRILEVMLREAYPEVRFEVVNTAMTAINSHVVLPIARESVRHEPDLFLVYLGNNEVVGPYGPATVFTGYLPGLRAIRWAVSLKGTRTGQLAKRFVRGLVGARHRAFAQWRGMEMLTEERIAADDPRLATVYAHFQGNLDDLLDSVTSTGARVVIATVATNLSSNPPFASLHRAELLDARRASWEELRAQGHNLLAAGHPTQAVSAYREALKIDDRHAELQFELGQALLSAGRKAEAARYLVRARDLDALRFRADSRINDIVRTAARRRASRGVDLLDAEQALAEAGGGLPRDDLFWEHVHFTYEGSYELARAFFARVAPLVSRRFRVASPAQPPTPVRCAELLALTDWGRFRMAASILEMMSRPPFGAQVGHRARLETLRRRVQLLSSRARATLPQSEATYRDALRRAPADLQLHASFATFLRERGSYLEAADEWRLLLEKVPGVAEWRAQRASSLADQAMLTNPPNRAMLDEATGILRKIAEEEPGLPAAHLNLGNVLRQRGELDAAAGEYRRALDLNPGYEVARFNLAALLVSRGRLDEAATLFREALSLDPHSAEAHGGLGSILNQQGSVEEAIAHYRRALQLNPEHVPARYNLAIGLWNGGDPEAAAGEFQRVLNSQPDHSGALIQLARILATSDAATLRNASEAVRLAERAVQATGRSVDALETLAAAHAAAGRPDEAVKVAGQALEMARARGDGRRSNALEAQLRVYRAQPAGPR